MMDIQKKKFVNFDVDLIHGPIFKSLVIFAIPLLISNIFQQLYNTVDTKSMKTQLREFNRKQHTISIGTCAPAPQIYLNQKVSRFYPDKTVY